MRWAMRSSGSVLRRARHGLASKTGWAGAVIHGAVRDVVALEELDFGVKALGSNPRKGGKSGTGEVDVPVRILVSEKPLVK